MARPIRILHLEDDPCDAELVLVTLTGAGIACEVERVETRETYGEAIRRGGYDLILSDFSLPMFDGASALVMARDLQPQVPFIIVSGTIGEDAAVESLIGGATDYVLKGRLARLVPAVQRALAEAENRRARRQAEEARQASEARYRRLFELSKDGLLILEGNTGRILDASPSMLELLGLGRAEVVGRAVDELAGDDPGCRAAFRDVRTRDEGHYADLRLRGRGGQLVDVEMVSKAYTAEGQRVVQCSLRDIRERLRLEMQLRQAQKLDAIGRLAGGVAHDFNNILEIIISSVEMALSCLHPADPIRPDLEHVRDAGGRAAALIRQLLAFSSRQFLQPAVLSVNEVVSGLESMLRRVIGEDVELRTDLSRELGNVRADPAQLEQVVMNLVVNARDAMPRGGLLTIGTRAVELDPACAAGNPDAKPGPYVLLTVTDTGCGMDSETLARIFEPFFTTKGPGGGTGLGLATVYGIVKQSGGHIAVQSEVGRGSTFQIYLPRVTAERAAAEPERRPVATGGSETVLLVDDDDGVRHVIQRVLQRAGYKVLGASSGEEAIRICERSGGPIDMLLTDAVMPVMDGRTVAQRVLTLRPGIRVLYMSGYMDDAIGRHGIPMSELDFLHKPFTPGDMLRRVREVLDRRAAETTPA